MSGNPGTCEFESLAPNVFVNVVSGDLYVKETDIVAKSSDGDVELDRSYNSVPSTHSGALGSGWDFNVGPNVRLLGSGSGTTVNGPSGWQLNADANGSFPGFQLLKLVTGSAGRTLQDPTQALSYVFDQSGHVSSTADAAGRTFSPTYTTIAGAARMVLWASWRPAGEPHVQPRRHGQGPYRSDGRTARVHIFFRPCRASPRPRSGTVIHNNLRLRRFRSTKQY